MATFREVVYLCLDEIKGMSDDFTFTEEHVIFVISKYRAMLLKKKYGDIKKQIVESNYQDLFLTLVPVTRTIGTQVVTTYLKSNQVLPKLLQIGNTRVYGFEQGLDYFTDHPVDYFNDKPLTLVSRDRLRFVGNNRFLDKVVYCAIAPDGHMYFKSNDETYQTMTDAKVTGIFEDCDYASRLEFPCCAVDVPDLLDRRFPLEEEMIQQVVQLTVQELLGASYRPEDRENDAKDAVSDLATYIARNAKSNLSKQLEQ